MVAREIDQGLIFSDPELAADGTSRQVVHTVFCDLPASQALFPCSIC